MPGGPFFDRTVDRCVRWRLGPAVGRLSERLIRRTARPLNVVKTVSSSGALLAMKTAVSRSATSDRLLRGGDCVEVDLPFGG